MFGWQVTTVSPTYAAEALSGGAAGWLRSTLAKPEVGMLPWQRTHSFTSFTQQAITSTRATHCGVPARRCNLQSGKRAVHRFYHSGLWRCAQVRAKFTGVLNGIDSVEWDPAADPLLPANFSPAQPAGKALCKQYLQVSICRAHSSQ